MRYVTPRIGSRNSQTSFYWLGSRTQVMCGCSNTSLDIFIKKVKATHANTKYEQQYMKEVKKVKWKMRMERGV